MTLLDSIAARVRTFAMTVRINGAPVIPLNPRSPDGTPGVGRVTVSRSFDDRVPRVEIVVNRAPTRFSHGKPVTIDMGYDGITARRFTGTVESPSRGFTEGTITCVGQLWKLYDAVDVPEFDATGMTIQAAIENRLDLAGITGYDVAASLDYVLGSVVDAILSAGPLADHVAQLMDIRDAEAYELSTGQVLVRPIEFVPAPTATGIAYDSETQALARIIDGSDREDWKSFKDKVVATGASVPDGDPTDPATTFAVLSRSAEILDSPLAALYPLGPGAHRTAILSQPLIDTIGELEAYVSMKLTRFARVARFVSLDLGGDPTLELGQTRAFNLPIIDVSGRWFVYGLVDSDDNSPQSDGGDVPGYHSFVTLRGGDLAGGSVGIYPIAAFTWVQEQEMIGVGTTPRVIVRFDATASFDPDGDLVDANIAWSDTESLLSGTGFIKQGVVDPDAITPPWIVTVTVTDADGLISTSSQTVDVSAGASAMQIPAIGVAAETYEMFSPDGAATWVDHAESDSRSVALRPNDGVHHGHALFGFEDGHIELTRDGNVTRTTVLAAVGSPIRDVAWDWRNTLVAWAVTDDARLYVCVNMDATTPAFGLYENLRTVLGLSGARCTKVGLPVGGAVYVYGGTGTGFPLTAYDALLSHAWVQQIVLGDLLTDGAGSSDLRMIDFALGNDIGDEAMILADADGRANGSIAIYHTTAPPGPSRTWTRATGIDAGLVQGRVMLGNAPLAPVKYRAIYGDVGSTRHVFESVDGLAWTKIADVLPAGYEANHGMWLSDVLTGLPDFDDIYLLALMDATGTGGVYKSTDGLQSVFAIRPMAGVSTWPAGAKARKLSIGAPGAAPAAVADSGNLLAITRSASPRTSTKLIAPSPTWTALVGVTGITDNDPVPFCVSSSIFIVTDYTKSEAPSRSADGGATWSQTGQITGMRAIAKDPNARLWGLVQDNSGIGYTVSVYYSDTDGASWTLSSTFAGVHDAYKIACHPTDQNMIVIWADGEIWITTDRGANWANRSGAPAHGQYSTGGEIEYGLVILQSGRIVQSGVTSINFLNIYTSDDGGVTWTQRTNHAANTYRYASLAASGTTVLTLLTDITTFPYTSVIMLSTDSGTSFAALAMTSEQSALSEANSIDCAALAVDWPNLALYTRGAKVAKYVPLNSASGVWTDLTDAIGSTNFGGNNLAVIPA